MTVPQEHPHYGDQATDDPPHHAARLASSEVLEAEEVGLPERVGQNLAGDLAATSAALLRNLPPVAPPPVAAQAHAPSRGSQLQSEKVVIAAPMSLAGSAARIWKLVRLRPEPAARIALGAVAILLIGLAWTLVLTWYLVFGLLLVPYRLIRRGSRRRKREALQHREMTAAIQSGSSSVPERPIEGTSRSR
jgi:hypothetical protein